MLWTMTLLASMTSVGYAQTSATVNTTSATGTGSITEAVTTINGDASGGTITFEITGGGTISYGSTITMTSPVSFVNASTAAADAVTVNLGSGTLDVTSAGTISLGSNTTLENTGSVITTTSALTVNTLAGTLSSTATSGIVAGINSTNSISIGDLSGSISITNTGTSGNAYGLYTYTNPTSSTQTVTISDGFSGSITTEAGMNATGIYATHGVTISKGFTGTIQSTSNNTGSACGIESNDGDITINGGMGGSITSTAGSSSGFAYGLEVNNAAIVINGDLSSKITTSGYYSYGLNGFTGVTVNGTLSGTIDATSTSTSYGYAYGLYSASTVGVTDGITGTVSAKSDSGSATAIYGYNGVNGGSTDKALEISGTVSASGEYATGVFSYGTINLKLDSTGTLSTTSTGVGANNYAIYAAYDSDYEKSYNSTIELVAGCKLTGNILLESGTADVLTLSGTTGSTTLDGYISKAETINITGGNWTLNGDILDCNALSITGGSAAMNGTTYGTVTVGSAGALSGTGTFSNLVNNGTISPGKTSDSIGTMIVNTKYTNNVGSTLNIDVNSSGESDKIAIGGTAVISGGTVSVHGASGTYTSGTTYTFLAATGGVTGTFSDIVDDLAFLNASLVYGTDYVEILLSGSSDNYDSVAVTSNQHGVARYLDSHSGSATGDFSTVLTNIDTLTASGARAAYDSMSGELHSSLATINVENNERFFRSIANRMRGQSMAQGVEPAVADANRGSLTYVNRLTSSFDNLTQKMSGWTTWFDSYGVGASIGSNGNASGLSYSTGGFTVGMERYLDENTLFGFGGGYSTTSTTLDSRDDKGSIDGGQFTVYMRRDIDTRYLTGMVAYGYDSYSTHRSIDFGSIDRTANADYHGNNYSAYFEAGKNIYGRFVNLQPFAALEYIGVQQNGYTEQDADSIDLQVDGTTANSFRGFLGARILNSFHTKSGRSITWDATFAWRHEFLNDNRVIDASFAGQTGGSFAIAGVNVDRDAAIVGTGLKYAMTDHFTVYANYDLQFSNNYAAHTGLGGLQYSW